MENTITPGTRIEDLLTPRPVIDEARMEGNIARVQAYFDSIGRDFRPHIKTHKIPALALAQLEAGAKGINCQKISEAEVFADAGITDILITYNILGASKLARLKSLAVRSDLKVVADNATVIDGLARTFSADHPLKVLVECETGARRNGIMTPEEALGLAKQVDAAPGLIFQGIMTYPKPGKLDQSEAFFARTLALLKDAGIACEVVSIAGTPGIFQSHEVPSATEHRAGTYIYCDRMTVRSGHSTQDHCAMTILVTVISTPEADRAVLDSGSKTLTSDLGGFPDHGVIVEYPEARIVSLSEEHAVVDLSACAKKPVIGERLQVIPNHTCVVSNMFDDMVFHRDGIVTRVEKVAARGLVW